MFYDLIVLGSLRNGKHIKIDRNVFAWCQKMSSVVVKRNTLLSVTRKFVPTQVKKH